jgi:hypothetical protein
LEIFLKIDFEVDDVSLELTQNILPKVLQKMLSDLSLPQEFTAMDQFYKRFNKVMLDKLALEKQKFQLDEENSHLKNILKQYLDGISLTDGVLSQPNPLMVVNGEDFLFFLFLILYFENKLISTLPLKKRTNECPNSSQCRTTQHHLR